MWWRRRRLSAVIQGLARIPKTPRGEFAWVALFALLKSLISWGMSVRRHRTVLVLHLSLAKSLAQPMFSVQKQVAISPFPSRVVGALSSLR